MFRELYVE